MAYGTYELLPLLSPRHSDLPSPWTSPSALAPAPALDLVLVLALARNQHGTLLPVPKNEHQASDIDVLGSSVTIALVVQPA